MKRRLRWRSPLPSADFPRPESSESECGTEKRPFKILLLPSSVIPAPSHQISILTGSNSRIFSEEEGRGRASTGEARRLWVQSQSTFLSKWVELSVDEEWREGRGGERRMKRVSDPQSERERGRWRQRKRGGRLETGMEAALRLAAASM